MGRTDDHTALIHQDEKKRLSGEDIDIKLPVN